MGRLDKGIVAPRAGASGMILCNAEEANKDEIIADLHVLPATHITMLTSFVSTLTLTLPCNYRHSKMGWPDPAHISTSIYQYLLINYFLGYTN
ncbi:hypothetical protein HanRHA438_Chr12g0551731 [Helianthus annuus]|uniref:Uncharacterized protein n=1 Tax=Helianthus annuus TaxID=4232 RepID=A0A251T4V3_HELAN|nr:hypothetical protein HanXRQr2_Chr12g0540871 [Helianthus annuus]KAJ0489346.1 hypothetical protein HanHA300_Chr12g0443011 [Helianthus annuus]KAJ0505226.1 hypothetical protein HanHA89_Chr12g0468131 [Helianthus annuus]KAJ0674908.1 hypothetical protein HanLR1_Chr12g0445231 [Helianthus annuus]KAJ0725504.1 hypothetical protein HanPI659440_Chr12g0459531 [Helianthus annuus]